MKKIILITTLISSLSAYSFFDNGFNNLRYNIQKQFDELEKELNSVAKNNFFKTNAMQYFDNKNNNYVIKINTIATKDNVQIKVKDNYIIITGKTTNKNNNSYASNSFYQSFSLPKDADSENIIAKFNQQILTITIPKLQQEKTDFTTIKIE